MIILILSFVLTDNFFGSSNIKSIFDTQACLIIAALGFTLVMITGELDLSVGSVLTFGMITFTYHANHYGLFIALILTCFCGALIGSINGFLVAKLKVDSFITTLASMIIVEKLNMIITNAETYTLSNEKYETTMETLSAPLLGWQGFFLSNLVGLVIVLVLLTTFFLNATRPGRNLYLIGANEKTAWYSGISSDFYKMSAFTLSGMMAALGGAVYVLTNSSVNFDEGSGSLMTIIAAVIVGGTSMQGGKGSVFQSFIAIFSLAALIKLLNLLEVKPEMITITNGVVLGSVILYDAYLTFYKKRIKGQRHELLEELNDPQHIENILREPEELEEGKDMQKNNSLMIVCVTAIACTAIVAMMVLSINKDKQITINIPTHAAYAPAPTQVAEQATVAAASTDPYALTSIDGQPLLPRTILAKDVPSPFNNYKTLPETDPNRWYDYEYGMHNITPRNDLPKSPSDGPQGKKIAILKIMDHPYFTAGEIGAKKAADAYGIELKIFSAQGKHSLQAQQVAQVITEKIDLVIIQPVNAESSVKLLKSLHKAKIPVIVANQRTTPEGLKYALCWSGPDDWGNARKLSHIFVNEMGNKGEYAIIRHNEGNTCFESRTWGFVTEIAKLSPNMKCVAKEATKLDAEKTRLAVAGWLKQYPNLKGIISSDDGDTITGIKQACEAAGKTGLIIVASGHSKVGMDNITSGFVNAINFQSAETDGALPVKLAADWFSGKKIEFINYLPKAIIKKNNVKNFYPAQW